MWLGGRGWFGVLEHWRCDLRRPSFARTWSGFKGSMAETLSTQVGTAGGLRAPHQQNGDAGGDARVEPTPGSPKPAGQEVEPAPVGGEHPSAAAPGLGKRKKRRGATGERVVPPPKKRRTGVSFGDEHFAETSYYFEGGLRKVRPYYFDFRTYCKGRWVGHSLLHVFSTEFRAQPLAYYEAAVRAGRLHLNEKPVQDLNIVLKLEKEYVCRVEGEFPTEEVTCKEPILVVSYKVGVCRVDTRGKPCETVFQRLSYNGQSSVVRCRPLTGRTHQIRVHLQFLGHPILNDPIYNSVAWGPSRGRGGRIPKTDEELLRDLVAEHQAKQSLDVLDLCEGDLSSGLTDSTAPSSELGKDSLEELAAAAQKMEEVAEAAPQKLDTIALAPEKAVETDVMNQEADPLCAECRLVRQDPLPKDLVMFLHALRYKGPGFEYFSPMPAWAQDDWQKD
ncbi:PREDICTED: RNA pseudouridylate synthase domain-containing protein 2 isoform X4 [Rhinopithecus bieti]|uniref:RNA pseudouridylate synthase domain-containing protein 2 isoform X4 n=1 Tax=Rhinopithecus bieti TaxID=61621 RepID=UPI00083BB7DB|nr:PREDICTED: RNA pseudouridylate synthase domain-containing protein 2 isoform X4 [Rhinopithecus bieti]